MVKLYCLLFIILFSHSVFGKNTARLGDTSSDYERLGISKNYIMTSEHGTRTLGQPNTFEWWYSDAKFSNGIKVITTFFTKDIAGMSKGFSPKATIDIYLPSGKIISETIESGPRSFTKLSRKQCHIQVDSSFFKQTSPTSYEVMFQKGGIKYHAKMHSTAPAWRPETGHWFFKKGSREYYFGWIVSQPSAKVSAKLKISSQEKAFRLYGTGYSDHNWGNAEITKIINHWYWGRASFKGKTVIAADIISHKDYGFKRLPSMAIFDKGKRILSESKNVFVTREQTVTHPKSKKFYDNIIRFRSQNSSGIHQVSFHKNHDIHFENLVDRLKGFRKTLAKILCLNPTYIRTYGDAIYTHRYREGQVPRRYKTKAIWDQMHLGNNKRARISL